MCSTSSDTRVLYRVNVIVKEKDQIWFLLLWFQCAASSLQHIARSLWSQCSHNAAKFPCCTRNWWIHSVSKSTAMTRQINLMKEFMKEILVYSSELWLIAMIKSQVSIYLKSDVSQPGRTSQDTSLGLLLSWLWWNKGECNKLL